MKFGNVNLRPFDNGIGFNYTDAANSISFLSIAKTGITIGDGLSGGILGLNKNTIYLKGTSLDDALGKSISTFKVCAGVNVTPYMIFGQNMESEPGAYSVAIGGGNRVSGGVSMAIGWSNNISSTLGRMENRERS